MDLIPRALAFWMLAYFCGSLPFSFWVTYLVRRVDVRALGSGHATTTNTIRQAGWPSGILVFILDVSKGFLPTYLSMRYLQEDWAIAVTAALVVIGHCWPVFANFRGGMGLAAAGGSVLAVSTAGFGIGVGVLVALVLLMRHSARASTIAGFLIPFIFWILNLPDRLVLLTVAVGVVISLRFLIDWNRRYRELWLDREKPPTF